MPVILATSNVTQILTADEQNSEVALAWGPGTNTTVTRDATHVHAGSWAVKAVIGATTTNARWFTNNTDAIVAGTTYDLSAWVYCDVGANTSVRFEVDWLNGATYVSTTVGANQTLTNGSFVQMVENGFHTAPTGVTQARMIIKPATPTASTNYWSDDHSMTTGSSATEIRPACFGTVG